ncbi:hypothetical protein [Streptomyces niveus]|uniref:hypothetical protein n=1 Tax=Streptomyces niveus TaxID=193462 RepID=UPI003442367A
MDGTVAGALRNTGSGWQVIADAGHESTGITGVVNRPDHIELQHAVGGLKVSDLQISVDETYAARGLRCGASVGVDLSRIYLYDEPADRIGDYVYYASGAWHSENGVFTGFTFAGGLLTMTHEDMGTGGEVALANRGGLLAQAGALTATTTQLGFYTGAYGSLAAAASPLTSMRVYVTRFGRRTAVPPVAPASVVSAAGNLWVRGRIITAPVPAGCTAEEV